MKKVHIQAYLLDVIITIQLYIKNELRFNFNRSRVRDLYIKIIVIKMKCTSLYMQKSCIMLFKTRSGILIRQYQLRAIYEQRSLSRRKSIHPLTIKPGSRLKNYVAFGKRYGLADLFIEKKTKSFKFQQGLQILIKIGGEIS